MVCSRIRRRVDRGSRRSLHCCRAPPSPATSSTSRSVSQRVTFGSRRSPGLRATCASVPSIDIEVGSGGAEVQATFDLFETDLGTARRVRLLRWCVGPPRTQPGRGRATRPRARRRRPDPRGSRRGGARAGMALDSARRPTFVLAADRVKIGDDARVRDARPDVDRRADGRRGCRGGPSRRWAARRTRPASAMPPASSSGSAHRPAIPRSRRSRCPRARGGSRSARWDWQTLLAAHPTPFAEVLGVVRDVIGSTGLAPASLSPVRAPPTTRGGCRSRVVLNFRSTRSTPNCTSPRPARRGAHALGARCTVVEGRPPGPRGRALRLSPNEKQPPEGGCRFGWKLWVRGQDLNL